jgi:putative membrane protein
MEHFGDGIVHLPPKKETTKMKKIALTAALLMSATAAFAQSATEATGVNSALGVAPKTEDFILKASASDMFEIESSKLALQKGDDAVKKFAQQMITDHEKTSAELKTLLSGGKVQGTPATALTDDMKEEVDELAKLQGAEFNEEYIDDQVDAHEDAVDLFKRYAEEGENAELKAFAAKHLPALEHHYKMAQDMDKD